MNFRALIPQIISILTVSNPFFQIDPVLLDLTWETSKALITSLTSFLQAIIVFLLKLKTVTEGTLYLNDVIKLNETSVILGMQIISLMNYYINCYIIILRTRFR
jgi:hypothetical protein